MASLLVHSFRWAQGRRLLCPNHGILRHVASVMGMNTLGLGLQSRQVGPAALSSR